MTFNSRNIKKYKGKLIKMLFTNKFSEHNELTGEITASTKYNIIFNVNKSGEEITLKYNQIDEIRAPEKE